ncbi:MAG: hypothetical protein JOY99_11230 [Sphingomonadaceae bacterium]|nr:hypothetical protein [Sphingomonadaceae bacterium]
MATIDPKAEDKAKLAEETEIAEEEEYLIRKKARANAVDDGDAAHGGGMGATGSAPDFGRPKNFSGVDDQGL